MTRDYHQLDAFTEADALIATLYRTTEKIPGPERYGLQLQLRRAAVSVAANIVEGASRMSAAEYCRFLEVARASANECGYLLTVAHRLNYVTTEALDLAKRYEGVSVALYRAIKRIREFETP